MGSPGAHFGSKLGSTKGLKHTMDKISIEKFVKSSVHKSFIRKLKQVIEIRRQWILSRMGTPEACALYPVSLHTSYYTSPVLRYKSPARHGQAVEG